LMRPPRFSVTYCLSPLMTRSTPPEKRDRSQSVNLLGGDCWLSFIPTEATASV
jgi:hypothetical protein